MTDFSPPASFLHLPSPNLGVVVPPRHDDEVLDASRHKQLLLGDEAEVAGAQEEAVAGQMGVSVGAWGRGTGQAGTEGLREGHGESSLRMLSYDMG